MLKKNLAWNLKNHCFASWCAFENGKSEDELKIDSFFHRHSINEFTLHNSVFYTEIIVSEDKLFGVPLPNDSWSGIKGHEG